MSLPAIGTSIYFGLAAISQYADGRKRLAYTCAAFTTAIVVHQVFLTYYQNNMNASYTIL